MSCWLCRRRAVVLGLGAWLAGGPAVALASASALVLTCIDYRFLPAEQDWLRDIHLAGRCDWTALAGASLALSGFPHRAAATTFWDQLAIAHQLHHIERVVIVDHQDCGAFALAIDAALSRDPQRERLVHSRYLSRAQRAIHHRYPQLRVETFFATLDGQIHPLGSPDPSPEVPNDSD